MPLLIQNLTDEPHQQHTLLFEGAEIALTLRYYPTVQMWGIDAAYGGVTASGYKLSVGVLHARSRNFPFDFIVDDTSGAGLDPYRVDDFVSGRCTLYLLDTADMEALRGAPVPL